VTEYRHNTVLYISNRCKYLTEHNTCFLEVANMTYGVEWMFLTV